MAQDGFYIINTDGLRGEGGGYIGSGIAYYRNFKLGGGNDHEAPDDYVEVSHVVYMTWEAGVTKCVTFPKTGIIFEWNIQTDGVCKARGEVVGWADRSDNSAGSFANMTVFKDNGGFIGGDNVFGSAFFKKLYYVN